MEERAKEIPNNISRFIIDHKNKIIMGVTEDLVIKQLTVACKEIETSFDEIFMDEFKNLSLEISEILSCIAVGYRNASDSNSELLVRCGDLLKNSVNSIIASLHILRSGFRFQSISLLRGPIESCAIIIHLLMVPDLIRDFLNDKMQSTKSISFVDRQVPLFGQIWGILSNRHVHISSVHAAIYPLSKFNDKKEENALAALGTMGIATKIIAITTELTYFNYLSIHHYWEKVEEGKYKFIGLKNIESSWFNKFFIH